MDWTLSCPKILSLIGGLSWILVILAVALHLRISGPGETNWAHRLKTNGEIQRGRQKATFWSTNAKKTSSAAVIWVDAKWQRAAPRRRRQRRQNWKRLGYGRRSPWASFTLHLLRPMAAGCDSFSHKHSSVAGCRAASHHATTLITKSSLLDAVAPLCSCAY